MCRDRGRCIDSTEKLSIHRTFLLVIGIGSLLAFVNGCSSRTDSRKPATPVGAPARALVNAFDSYMEADSSPSDGFDFPVGDPNGNAQSGWTHENNFGAEESSGIHSGEDWNHAEGDNQSAWDVCAIAIGRVVVAQERGGDCGNVVVIEHTFYENYEKMRILSVYAHLSQIKVGNGEHVRRRQVIGSIGAHGYNRQHADLHLELRWDETLEPCYRPSADNKDRYWLKAHYSSPTEFIKKHRNLLVPQQEQLLILVHQESYKMRMYRTAQMQGEYEVSFGQGRGQKLVQGDNKTPKGMYFVTQKHRGYFGGPYGRYYGNHWIVINYPNKYDR